MKTAVLLFIICTFANVVLSTVKSVMTIKGGKVNAAIWNALAFGLYSYIVVLTATAHVSTVMKVVITAACNLVGVFGVKLVEEKMRKDRLWKIDLTVQHEQVEKLHEMLTAASIPNHYITAGKHTVFSCFCDTKEQTDLVLGMGKTCNAKTFASETVLAP